MILKIRRNRNLFSRTKTLLILACTGLAVLNLFLHYELEKNIKSIESDMKKQFVELTKIRKDTKKIRAKASEIKKEITFYDEAIDFSKISWEEIE
jgi:septal ring factor EnvC (AmiA/AmiB activator)